MKVFFVLILMIWGVALFAQDAPAPELSDHKLLVKIDRSALAALRQNLFADGLTGIGQIDSLNLLYGVHKISPLFPSHDTNHEWPANISLHQWLRLEFSAPVAVEALAPDYGGLAEVLVAEAVAIHPLHATPDDPEYATQWHHHNTGDHDIDSPDAWEISTGGPDVIVAVLDTGVRWWHLDLAGASASESDRNSIGGNMWINTAELSDTDPGVDEDGNGYDDDWVGWDFVNNITPIINFGDDYDVEDNNPSDHNGHGTHCAGNVGAINNNNTGVCAVGGGWGEDIDGLGNGVNVMALRIGWSDFPSGRVSMDFAASALVYAADNGASIASCSWGSSDNIAFEEAVNYFLYGVTDTTGGAPEQIGLIFKSAGNSSADLATSTDYLIGRHDVICVAATDSDDLLASFSNYGTTVEISAPGDNIYSTSNSGGYEYMSGTSMATPIAASAAALTWHQNPALSAEEVAQFLYDGADDIDALNPSYAGKLGAGRLNAYGSVLLSDQSLPVELVSFTAYPDGPNVVLTWDTASEFENQGFNILRRYQEEGSFTKIGSYLNNPSLQGLGTSSFGKTYIFTDSTVTQAGKYWYQIQDVDIAGRVTAHGPVSVQIENTPDLLADHFTLYQNYPNPFNPLTRIRYRVGSAGPKDFSPIRSPQQVTLAIYNLRGEKVATLVAENKLPGEYEAEWNAVEFPSGTYFYRLESAGVVKTAKMILIK